MRTSISQVRLSKSDRHPEADIALEKLKPCRHDTNDLEFLIVKQNLPADDAAFASKSALPQSLTPNYNIARTGLILFRKKSAPERRFDSEQREKICCYSVSHDFFRLAIPSQVEATPFSRRKILHRFALLLPVGVVRRRRSVSREPCK